MTNGGKRRKVPSECRGCGGRIGWVFSARRPRDYPNVPVDWDSLPAETQQAIRDGAHVEFAEGMSSHFTSCPKASDFSASRKE